MVIFKVRWKIGTIEKHDHFASEKSARYFLDLLEKAAATMWLGYGYFDAGIEEIEVKE